MTDVSRQQQHSNREAFVNPTTANDDNDNRQQQRTLSLMTSTTTKYNDDNVANEKQEKQNEDRDDSSILRLGKKQEQQQDVVDRDAATVTKENKLSSTADTIIKKMDETKDWFGEWFDGDPGIKLLTSDNEDMSSSEEDDEENNDDTIATFSNNYGSTLPGAYNFRTGRGLERNNTGFLSPHNNNNDANDASCFDLPVAALVAELAEEHSNNTTAIVDTTDIEEQVRQRILREAVRADVVVAVNPEKKIESSATASSSSSTRTTTDNKSTGSGGGLSEKLFGDSRPRKTDIDIAASPDKIRKRALLPYKVFYNHTTNMWVTSINTNQSALERNDHNNEASRSVKTFSSPSRDQAKKVGLANTPPRMLPFDENPVCFICDTKFAVLRRRPRHCRNCGVCVCAACSTPWISKMVPETYNIKYETFVNVCLACNWLRSSFVSTLVNGRSKDEAKKLYKTGNINLYCSIGNVNGEMMNAIHCASLGGNLSMLRWLIDGHFCPIKSLQPQPQQRQGGRGSKANSNNYYPILTSKGRSVLGIALTCQHIDTIRYLVADKQMSLFDEKDLSSATTIANLASVIKLLRPEDCCSTTTDDDDHRRHREASNRKQGRNNKRVANRNAANNKSKMKTDSLGYI